MLLSAVLSHLFTTSPLSYRHLFLKRKRQRLEKGKSTGTTAALVASSVSIFTSCNGEKRGKNSVLQRRYPLPEIIQEHCSASYSLRFSDSLDRRFPLAQNMKSLSILVLKVNPKYQPFIGKCIFSLLIDFYVFLVRYSNRYVYTYCRLLQV